MLDSLKLNITIDLTRDDVESIIKQAVEAQMQGHNVKGVEWTVEALFDSLNRPNGHAVKRAVVRLAPKAPPSASKVSL